MAFAPQPSALGRLKGLLRQIVRVSITDGRIFIGTFVGTDKPLNVLLINTEEFRIGHDENPDGRYVGQVLVPWRLVVKVEGQVQVQQADNGFDSKQRSRAYDDNIYF